MADERLVLVTGATGYIGGRLVPRLLEAGYRVRCLVRDARRLEGRPWSDQVEVVEGDATRPETLPPAMAGVWAAYYLIHSLSDTANYQQRDIAVARSFSQAAKAAGVERIIYLGGLGDPAAELSVHLRSRQETGEALGEGGVPVTEFRAAVIVGSGSLSFEMIRHLTERLPVMICPRWVFTRIQPIAIRDVLSYLVAALDLPVEHATRVIEIGGADVVSYGDMMKGYARVRGLRRRADPGAGAHAASLGPLGQLDDSRERGNRLPAHRRVAQRSGGARRSGHAPFPGHRAGGLRHRCASSPGQPGGRRGGNHLDR